MLTKYDELLCHQIASTFDHVSDSGRQWTEKLWFNAHHISGKAVVAAGFGSYPNRNVMDGYSLVVLDGRRQYNLRLSRELRPRMEEVRVGPLSHRVIEGLQKVQWSLAENDYGISYEIEFEGTMPAHEEIPQFFRNKGRVVENICRFVQCGRPRGWLRVEDKTFDIEPGTWRAHRDHSWGIRTGGWLGETGVQPEEPVKGFFYNWISVVFEDRCLNYHLREDDHGQVTYLSGAINYLQGNLRPETKIVDVKHDYQFYPGTRRMKSGRILCTTIDGSRIDISIQAPDAFVCLRGAGYLGYKNWNHGKWMGSTWMDGETLDLTDQKTVKEISFIDDLICRFKCGDEVGYGINELLVIGDHPRYGFSQ